MDVLTYPFHLHFITLGGGAAEENWSYAKLGKEVSKLASQIRALLPPQVTAALSATAATPSPATSPPAMAVAATIHPDEFSVVTFVDHGPIMVVSHLAIMAAGGVLVPADSTYPPERLKLMIKETGCVLALVHAHDRQQLVAKLAAGDANGDGSSDDGSGGSDNGGGSGSGEGASCSSGQGGADSMVLVEVESIEGYSMGADGIITPPVMPSTLEELEEAAEAAAAAVAAAAAHVSIDEVVPVNFALPSKLCHIVFTSGSTGAAKGVMTEHRALYTYGTAKNAFHGIGPTSRVLMASAITWDPSIGDVYPTLMVGGTLCIAPRALIVHDLAAALKTLHVSHVFATPALWSMLDAGPDCLSDLKVVALGGEPIPRTAVEEWSSKVRFINTYGVTECTVCQTAGDTSPTLPARNIGAPLPGADVRIVVDGGGAHGQGEGDGDGPGKADADATGHPVGELYIGGNLLGRGYLNSPEVTASKFVTLADDVGGRSPTSAASGAMVTQEQPTRWFKTGDLGRWTADGSIELLGRADGQVKLRGFRIELGEVEATVRSSMLVDGCAARKCDNPERLVVYITLPAAVTKEAFAQGGWIAVWLICKRAMPAHQIPTQYVLLDKLPLTSSGKLDRKALPDAPRPGASRKADGGVGVLAHSRSTGGAAAAAPAPDPGAATGANRDAGSGSGVDDGAKAISAIAGAGMMGEGNRANELRTATEVVVAHVWGQVLAVEGVGPHDHFYELGGSSLLAVEMLHALSKQLAEDPNTAPAAFPTDADHIKVRYCGLARKPRLRDYAALLDWAGLAAPNRSNEDAAEFRKKLGGNGAAAPTTEELLAQLDADLPGEADELGRGADALSMAAQHAHMSVVEELLRLGVSPDGRVTRDNRANTPMMIAASHGHGAVVALLVEHGAKANLTNRSQATVAHLAAMQCPSVLPLLLDKAGAVIESRDLNKWGCLHYAAWFGQAESIAVLLARHVRIDAKDRWGRTALGWAVYSNSHTAVELLLAGGAAFHAKFEKGRSAPQARHQRRTDNVWSSLLHLALQAACRSSKKPLSPAMAVAGPASASGKRGGNGVGGGSEQQKHDPQQQQHEEEDPCAVLAALLRHGCPVDEQDGHQRTALHEAAAALPYAALRRAGAVDSDPNGTSASVGSPHDIDVAERLLKSSVHHRAATLLLAGGADVNAKDSFKRTALHIAAAAGDSAMTALLLDNGANPMAVDENGCKPGDGVASLGDSEDLKPPYCCVILAGTAASASALAHSGDGNVDEPRYFFEVRGAEAKVAAGKLTCFGGKREKEEIPSACVARECAEELGWKPAAHATRACDLYVDGKLIAWFYVARAPEGAEVAALKFEPGRAGLWASRNDPRISPWHACVLEAYATGKTRADFVTPADGALPRTLLQRPAWPAAAAAMHWPFQAVCRGQAAQLCLAARKDVAAAANDPSNAAPIQKSGDDEHLGGTPTSSKPCKKFNTAYPCTRLEEYGKRCIFGHYCSVCGGPHSAQECAADDATKAAAVAAVAAADAAKKAAAAAGYPQLELISVKQMKPAELKKLLKKHGLSENGNKKQLLSRATAYFCKTAPAAAIPQYATPAERVDVVAESTVKIVTELKVLQARVKAVGARLLR